MWLFKKKTYLSDEELVKAYKETGNNKAFGELFEKHIKVVYGACLFYFKNKSEAQDVSMQIFEKLLIELRKKEINYFKGWLSFVVRNHCITLLRQNKRHVPFDEKYMEFEYELPNEKTENALNNLRDEEVLENIPKFLEKLKPTQKNCIHQFFIENKSYQEISENTGFTIKEVKSYLQNGKRNLKLLILDFKNENK
ncbi:MAG: sigma-70 family RNA polymerase sigma factor [Bacteroidia bacterium]|nr:sigma-70 family RNA polymerase sigma factor [Bacteroidia bacterium]